MPQRTESPPPTGWRSQPERGNSLALHIIRWIATRIGRPPARALLYPITLYFFLSAGNARRMSRRFLQRAGRGRVHSGHVLRHLHTFAAVILDRVYFLRGEMEHFDIRLHLAPGTREHLAEERGALMLGAHVGSFDALRALGLQNQRAKLKVLMHHDHNQLITQFLEALNPDFAETVIPLGRPDTLLRTKEWVDEGGCVALLGDRIFASGDDARGRSLICDFLGHPAQLPTGPMRLAGTLRTPVMLFFAIYRGGKRYDVYLEWLTDADEVAAHREPDVLQRLVQRYAARLEAYSLDAPYNWFNFYDFWQSAEEPDRQAQDG